MNRREFIAGALSTTLATAISPISTIGANAQTATASITSLTDVETGRNFEPEEGKFNFVLFMTAAQHYPSCGGAFLTAMALVQELDAADEIQPILVMPNVRYQQNPSDTRNLSRATNSPVDFKILTGEINDIVRVARGMGAFYEFDANGRIAEHSQDAFFTTPSGNKLIQHRADDHISLMPLVGRILENCGKPRNAQLCM